MIVRGTTSCRAYRHRPIGESCIRSAVITRICIVNDDYPLATLLASLLAEGRGDSVICTDSSTVFSVIREQPPDLIILDLQVQKPEGGWDILTFLRLHPTLRHVPVVVCSGETDELLAKEEWLRDHAVCILTKPFDLDELSHCVDVALKRDGAA